MIWVIVKKLMPSGNSKSGSRKRVGIRCGKLLKKIDVLDAEEADVEDEPSLEKPLTLLPGRYADAASNKPVDQNRSQ
jgi:hypothetical protein